MVLTLNRKHFIRLHHEGKDHCGIVVCTMDINFVGLAQRIHEEINSVSENLRPLIRINRLSR